MEKQYLFTLKDIIFSLRIIYLEYQRELSKLKQYCQTDNVADFNFYIHQSATENPKLYCDFMESKNKLNKLTEYAKSLLYGKDPNENSAIYQDDKLEGFVKICPISILPDKTSDFANQTNKILSSEFITSFNNSNEGIMSLCERGKLYLRTNNIEMIPNETYALPALFYSPLSDTLTLSETNSTFKVSEFDIKRIMETYFFNSSFTPYQLTAMNSTKIKNKKFVIEQFNPCSKIQLKIEENDKAIRLSKVKK